MKASKKAMWLAFALAAAARETHGARLGLLTRLSEINLTGLEIGQSYNIRLLKNMPYVVVNNSEMGVDLAVDVKPPAKGRLKDGYEPVPDPSWVKVLPDHFHLEPDASSFCELILSVPDDPKWKDRNYQALLTARTVGTGSLAVGVNTHLYFSTGAGPAPKAKAVSVPDFELSPETVRVSDVEPGRKVNAKKEHAVSLKVVNKSDVPFKIDFKVVPFDANHQVPADFEAASSSAALTLSKDKMKVKADSIQELTFTLALPTDAYGKHYAFLIKGELEDIGVPIEIYAMVLVTAKQKQKQEK